MEIVVVEGLNKLIYQYIAPFAMDMNYIKANGNPITTSELHKWFIGFHKGDIQCFCSVKYALGSKNMQIGNFFTIRGNEGNLLIEKVITTYTKERQLGLRAFSNDENLEMFEGLGFIITKKGKNWHRLKYEA